MSLEETIEECLVNNPKAQRELYNLYAKTIMHACERFFKDRDLINDAFQQSVIVVFNKLNLFDKSRGKFSSWVYKIAINCSLEIIRKNKHQVFTDSTDDLSDENVYIEDNDLEYKDLKELIDRLPEGQRYIFNLYAIEGYKHKEIAEMLNISVGTSKSQLNKARANLKESYTRHFV